METQSTKSEPAPSLADPERPANEAEAVVTLPSTELAWALARAEREGTTIAAVVTGVVRKARQDEAWAEFRDWTLEGQPPITDEERAAAEREWRGTR